MAPPPTDVLVASPSSSSAVGSTTANTTSSTPIPPNRASLQRIRRARERWEASKKKLRPVEQGGEGLGVVSPLAPPPSPSSFRSPPRGDARAAGSGSGASSAGIGGGGSAAKDDKAVSAVAKGSGNGEDVNQTNATCTPDAMAATTAPAPAPAPFTFSMSPPSSLGAKPAVKIDFGVGSKVDSWGGSKGGGAAAACALGGGTAAAAAGGGGFFSSVKVPTATGVVTEEGATPTPSTAFSFGGGSISSGGTGGGGGGSTAGFGAAGSAVSKPLFGASAPAPKSFFGASAPAPAPAPLFGAATAVKKSDGKSEDEEDNATDYHAKLVAFYTKHNPSKLSTVDKTLESYKGKEEVLFQKLERKYCPSASAGSAPAEVALPPGVLPPPPVGEVKDNRPTVYLDLTLGGETLGRVTIQLYTDLVPLASENFRALCTGEKGNGRSSGKPLHYKGCSFHWIVPNFVVQGGDFTKHNGTGGESIYAGTEHGDMWGKFKDETPFLGHTRKGLLSMANNGPNANGSQFFITLRRTPHLDGKHVVFGCVTDGMEFVDAMVDKTVRDKAGKPTGETKVVINNCGEIGGKKKATSEVAKTITTDTSASASTSAFSFGAKQAGSSFSFGATTKPPAFSFTKAPVPAPVASSQFGLGGNKNKEKAFTPAPAPVAKAVAASSSAFPPMSTAAPKNPFASVKLVSGSTTTGSVSTSSSSGGGSGFSFGAPSTLGGGSGAPATTKGGFSFGSTGSATFGSPPAKLEGPKATKQEKTAPIFGSGSKAPVFGSGGGGGGFAALASSPAATAGGGGGGGVGSKTSSSGFGFGFGSSSSSTTSGVDSSMVKPLFGSAPAPVPTAAPAPAPTTLGATMRSDVDDSNGGKKEESSTSFNASGISEIVSSDSEERSEDESAAGVSTANSTSSSKLVFGEKFFGSIPSPGKKESSAISREDKGSKNSTVPTAINTISARTPNKNAKDVSSSPGSGYKGWKEVISNDKSSARSTGKGTMVTSATSTPVKPSPKVPPKASPSIMREKSLQGSLEEKIRGMNKSPTTPPKKAHTEIKSSTPSSAKSSSSVPSYLRSTFASRGQQLEKDDTNPSSEVKCEACGWRTADIDSSATGTPIREKRCAMCKARHLKYTGSSPAKAHKGGSH